MSVIQGQQTYQQFSTIAVPGQLADMAYAEIVSFPAAEVIQPGRMVQLASDGLSVQQVRDTSADTPPTQVLGLSLLQSSREGSGAFGIQAYGVGGAAYQIGDTVPVLMRGRAYAEWSGTTQPAFANGLNGSGTLHVFASSTVATNRGIFTDTAVSAGAGTEVAYAGQQFMSRQALPGGGNVILVDVNLPSAA